MSTLREAAQAALETLDTLLASLVPNSVLATDLQRKADALRAALAQQEQANYPEEKLQAVAEYISNQYHVWYGVAARDVEEVLRQSVSCGLVNNPPRREWRSLSEEEIKAIHLELCKTVGSYYRTVARAVEQALRSKNNG